MAQQWSRILRRQVFGPQQSTGKATVPNAKDAVGKLAAELTPELSEQKQRCCATQG